MGVQEKRLVAREQDHHERAFEFYYRLGGERSYQRVAQEFQVSEGTVKLWGRSFGWKERVRERDVDIAREVAGRTLSDEVSHRERNVKILQMAMIQLAKAIVDGRVKMTLADLDKLIRLEAFLKDEPDSRQEVVFADFKNKSAEELRELIQQEVRVLKELEAHDPQDETSGGHRPSLAKPNPSVTARTEPPIDSENSS
jgi:transposase